MAADSQFARRMGAGAGHFGIVGEDGRKKVALEKIGHDEKIEGIALERRSLQRGVIAIIHQPLRGGARSAMRRA